jgi:hypothetical protein
MGVVKFATKSGPSMDTPKDAQSLTLILEGGVLMRKLLIVVLILIAAVLALNLTTSDNEIARNYRSAAHGISHVAVDRTFGRVADSARDLLYRVRYRTENGIDLVRARLHRMNQGALDASITAAVKMKLASDDKLTTSKIQIQTQDGNVMLYGTVPNQRRAERAVALAYQAEGVSKVTSRLQVQDPISIQ